MTGLAGTLALPFNTPVLPVAVQTPPTRPTIYGRT